MATPSIVAAKMEQAHEAAVAVVRKLAPGRDESGVFQNMTISQATTRHPAHLAAFQAELIGALAEICEDQDQRLTELEKAGASKTTARKK